MARPDEGTSSSSSTPVVAARVAVLLLALAAVVAAFHLTGQRGQPVSRSAARYACPMHREVTAGAPGDCPICGMALQPLAAEDPAASSERPRLAQHGSVDSVRRRIFSHELRAPASIGTDGTVAAVLFEDDLATLSAGERGEFHPASDPRIPVPVRLGTAPPAPWDGSTSLVQFRLEQSTPALAPVVGWVELPARQRAILVVPSSALLWSDGGPYVLAAAEDGRTFNRRAVRIGKILYGFAAVISGLREGERVVVRGAFFLDRDRGEIARSDAQIPLKP